MKKVKKALSIVLTSIVAVTGILSVPASAVSYNYKESWTAYGYCYPNAPSSASSPAIKSVVYSTYGTYIQVTAMSNNKAGSEYQLVITSLNGKMDRVTTKNLSTHLCKPEYEGVVPCATFQMSAVSLTNGNTFMAKGQISTNKNK